MCDICLRTPCASGCPNAPEPPVFAKCDECGEEIYDGDEYVEVGDLRFCTECVHYRTAEVYE